MIARKRKQKKGFNDNKILTGLLIVLNLLIIGFLVFGNLRLHAENRAVRNQHLDINREVELLEERNEELRDLFALASQEEYERLLRNRGMFRRPGEEVVVIIRDEVAKFPIEQGVEIGRASVLEKIINFLNQFFGRD